MEKSQVNTPKVDNFLGNIEEAKYGGGQLNKARGQSPTHTKASIDERK